MSEEDPINSPKVVQFPGSKRENPEPQDPDENIVFDFKDFKPEHLIPGDTVVKVAETLVATLDEKVLQENYRDLMLRSHSLTPEDLEKAWRRRLENARKAARDADTHSLRVMLDVYTEQEDPYRMKIDVLACAEELLRRKGAGESFE